MIKLRHYQEKVKAEVMAEWERGNRNVLAVMPTGAGKCLGRGTPVLMFDGTVKPVELVAAGDDLMGPDSQPRRVLSTCTGRETLYRVTPVKGDPYVVNESHILSLKKTGTHEVVNLSVGEYLRSSRAFKHTHKGWRAAVSWGESALSPAVPPYLLGIWLGDGSSRGPSVTTADPEVADYLREFALASGQNLRTEALPGNAANTYHLSSGYQRSGSTRSALRALGLLNNKHVPHAYKTGSDAQRMELLAGLLDSDGYLTHGGYDVVFKVRRLADDLAFVARSLGFAAYVTPCKKTCTNTGATDAYFRISISGDCARIPTKLERHQPPARRQKKSVLVTGLTVEPIGDGDYFGFTIDGDHLFMLGDFTVTHNTVTFASIVSEHKGAACIVVHRREILSQISQAVALVSQDLAGQGKMHRVVAPPKTIAMIRRKHLEKFGRSFVDPQAHIGVASVQTLTSAATAKDKRLQAWVQQVTLAVFDEGHHYVEAGFWAKGVNMFDRAKRLFVTATPERADGTGLGKGEGGFADVMVEGPTVKQLIDWGHLCKYTYYCPDSDADFSQVAVTASGDFNAQAMRSRVVESHLVGDIVGHYQKFTPNTQAICFMGDTATADEVAAAFTAAGVKAVSLNAKTDDAERERALVAFERGDVAVLVNVDLFDEGFDVPAATTCIIGRPTMSLAKYMQMVGRVLRTADGKTMAYVIDPVRNWERHGQVTFPRQWSLKGREKSDREKSDRPQQRVCLSCSQPYEAFRLLCPYCGMLPDPPERRTPEQVDGDLTALDLDALNALFAAKDAANMDDDEFARGLFARRVPTIGHGAQLKRFRATKYRRGVLENLIGWWAGHQTGREPAEVQKRFYLRFGVDMLSAMALDLNATDELIEKIASRFDSDLK